MTFDVVVIGAGAAGLFCASTAAKRGKSVALIDHNVSPGKKIRISGGGRCNFTNLVVGPNNFISQNPHFARSALSRYTPNDFINLVDSYRIKWHEKTLGQLFCDGSAQQIIVMLVNECNAAGVTFYLGTTVTSVSKADDFTITTSECPLSTSNVVIATGGLSIPKLGASDFGYRIAKQFGVGIVPTAPALVPIVCSHTWQRQFGNLAGVSLNVECSSGDARFTEGMLFTHRGLTGPAVLQASSYMEHIGSGGELQINTLPGIDIAAVVESARTDTRHLQTLLSDHLPKRLLQTWPGFDLTQRSSDVKKQKLVELLDSFQNWVVKPTSTEGYAKAEVTRGGVDTNHLSSKTMEVESVKGLYFIGEVVDVTGWLGGYNFQWAWSSGYAAGSYI